MLKRLFPLLCCLPLAALPAAEDSHPTPLTQLEGRQVVNTLSECFEWAASLYRMDAGVSEGYTIGQHTGMVIDTFRNDFDTIAENALLEEADLTREDFVLFLAMHDLGKGPAVRARGSASCGRKEIELRLGRQIINSLGTQLQISPEKQAIFTALLNDDSIGSLCKQPFVTSAYALRTAFKLKKDADECGMDATLFTRLKVLFHMCDASSYPGLRTTIFEETLGVITYSDRLQHKIDELFKALEVTKHPLVINPDEKQSYSKLRHWESMKRHLSKFKRPFADPELQAMLTQFPMAAAHRMPWRVAQLIEAYRKGHDLPNGDCSRLANVVNRYPEKGDALVDRLLDEATGQEEKLALLDEITFLHGTNSATILVMAMRDDWRLTYLGDLLKENVAPMCGELAAGVGMDGINHKSISCETVRDLERVKSYASDVNKFSVEENVDLYLDPEFPIKSRMTPGCLHRLAIKLRQIRQWDEDAYREVMETHNVVEASQEVLQEVLYPMIKMLDLMERELTDAELAYVQGDFKGKAAESLITFFNKEERDACFGEEGNWYTPEPARMTEKGFVYRFHRYLANRIGEHRFWGETYRSLLMHRAGLEIAGGKDVPQVRDFLEAFTERLKVWYQMFEVLVAVEPQIRIPEDPVIRSLITEPFGVILASRSYLPESIIGRDEYLLHEPIMFGDGGIDLLFVEKEEHRVQVLDLLPEAIQEMVEVRLYEEIDVGDYPLFHKLGAVN